MGSKSTGKKATGLSIGQKTRQIKSANAGKAGIIGLGLIGGSLARALTLRAGLDVIGLDCDKAVLKRALSEKIIVREAHLPPLATSDLTTASLGRAPDDSSPLGILADCDYVFICTPVEYISFYAHQAARYSDGLISDVASVKQPIMREVKFTNFIGGHPMAGSDRQGYAHASESLFENAIYVLCLQENSTLPVYKIQELEKLIFSIGATPLHMGDREHDRAVAAVSHLPHVAAAALSLLAARLDDGNMARLAAGGFRDITRIASSDPDLWAGICHQSGAELKELIDQIIKLLQEFSTSLAAEDVNSLRRFFFQAAKYRNSLPVGGRGALISPSSLTVYINDQPGELGRVTTLLGKEGINIKNIRIREYRAYEGGCLQLLLPDSAQAVKAAWILKENGYVCD